MFKFFRKIRQQLLAENRFTKYLLYAIGEIILVVIGILIALALNNNHERKVIKEKEQTYLIGLQNEFKTSKVKLLELIKVNKNNYEGAKKIVAHIDNKNDLLTEEQFSKLLFNAFAFDISFNPNNSLLNEMLNSGSLKDISNSELKIYLSNWSATIDDIVQQEKELGIQREKVLDIFRRNDYSIRTVFDLSEVSENEIELSKAENNISNLMLLASTEFENNILMFILTSQATEKSHYLPLMQSLDTILELIDSEIKD